MKKFLLFALVAVIFAACGAGSQAEEAEVGEAQDAAALVGGAYSIDTEASIINWTGRKFGDDQHSGTMSLSEGAFAVDNGVITGGSFTLDMTSIIVTDEMPDEYKTKLVAHLNSDDFFRTESFPTSTFEITGVEAIEGDSTATHSIAGNFTMLDATHNVTFKANIVNDGGIITATSQGFTIDRTLWGVKTMAFGLVEIAKDKAIKKELELKVTLVANATEEG